jgi:hypothetical protein
MRSDMSKVIVERPRFGSHDKARAKGRRRELRREGLDGRRFEGIKCLRGGTRSLNEHLGPLRRYLESQVGRPWDKVFSEICEHINRNSAVQDHVRDHVDDYVETHVVFIDGVPCVGHPRGYGRPLVGGTGRDDLICWRHPLYYVCPTTGLLLRTTHGTTKAERRRRRRELARQALELIWMDETHLCLRVNGQWRVATMKPFRQTMSWSREYDVLLKRSIYPADAHQHYRKAVYAAQWRFLGKREMKQLPLSLNRS